MNTAKAAGEECDYLVIGGGAAGMAFTDALLENSEQPPHVIMVDQHAVAGGQWHDSYEFVQLHQPSSMYGVESKKLELSSDHRATRNEILQYYEEVQTELEKKYNFEFVGNTTLDIAQLNGSPSKQEYVITNNITGGSRTVRVRKRLVDARNLEPDLPISTPPKFSFPSERVHVAPVNDIVQNDGESKLKQKRFVVVGGGKTGMDAVSYLLTKKGVSPDNLLWVVPNDAWITARESIGNCIDLLYTCSKQREKDNIDTSVSNGIGSDFLQRGFLEWEKQGHIYRLDTSVVPTKFKDATLSLDELTILRRAIPCIVRMGRISEISANGNMIFEDGSIMDLPFPVDDTLFVHCSAGAFNFTKSNKSPPPVFEKHKIVIQDIYGTPGYCFVGSMLGKLESMTILSDEERNKMTLAPKPSACASPLGPSGGDVVGRVDKEHGLIQRAQNLRLWLQKPDLREWMFRSRLFNFAHSDPTTVAAKVNYIFEFLHKNGVIVDV